MRKLLPFQEMNKVLRVVHAAGAITAFIATTVLAELHESEFSFESSFLPQGKRKTRRAKVTAAA